MLSKNNSIRLLNSSINSHIDKYNYLICRYLNDITIDLRTNFEYDTFNVGFDAFHIQDSDLNKSAYTNVIASVIDSVVSKLSNEKVRPYFNSVKGTYKTKQVVRQVQKYFDVLYDKINAHDLVSSAFRSACIFGKGYIFINPFTGDIENVPTWCVSTMNSEQKYGKPTRMLIKYTNFPSTMLERWGEKSDKDYVELAVYVESKKDNNKAYLIIDGKDVKDVTMEGDELPLVEVYFNKPLYGNKTVSIVEQLDGIQTQIDLINAKISACAQLTPGNTTYVIEGSNLTPGDITNRVGNVFGIKMPPGTNTPPVVNITPAPFDPAWQNLLEYYIKQAYEIVGISQLSAMAKKPSGLDSGTSLKTMEDIESDRFETQVNNYISSYVELANKIINTSKEAPIFKDIDGMASFKWSDVRKQIGSFNIQYSAATALSKDPSEKLSQLLQLKESGLIGASKIATYLDTPDLEEAYAGAQAVVNGVEKCIELAIEEGEVEIPEFINYQTLAQEIAITENELYASYTGDKKSDEEIDTALSNLKILEEQLMAIMSENGFVDTTTDESFGEIGRSADITDMMGQMEDPMAAMNTDANVDMTDEAMNGNNMATEMPMTEEANPVSTLDNSAEDIVNV